MEINYTIKNNKFNTINEVLKDELHLSNRLLSKLIHNKKIYCNGKLTDTRNTVSLNDTIVVLLDEVETSDNIVATNMNLDIIYEDDSFLILNKPAGIAVHPSRSHYTDTLSNGVKFYFQKINLAKKIRPVNRLDLNTSGIVIFAKNEYVQECLVRQMKDGTFYKEYIAIVSGILERSQGTVNLPIARKKSSIIERCISTHGQEAITDYRVVSYTNTFSVLKCSLRTGRTHQIRVHMAVIGHPIIGDTLYGTPSDLINRQALHNYKVSFIHPATNKNFELICKLPDDMEKVLDNA